LGDEGRRRGHALVRNRADHAATDDPVPAGRLA
jgi:hypothetical protein